jgi:alpha-amylase/alpha-mannosidase (GH57 family)
MQSVMAKKSTPKTPNPSNRYLLVHGHFYQPPRENPWLETIELQDSAAPFHDWNERITAECYAPNGASRITNTQSQIVRIVNNYARMSFNFGPTLLSWLEDFAPRAYRMIQDADRVSAERYSNHGSALAQVYNHLIMPLASERDARTQIRWGIADFEHRFGRKPEGMWLSETAVSRKTLDLLAQERIKFTILAPNQAARIRKLPNAQPLAQAAQPRAQEAQPGAQEAQSGAQANPAASTNESLLGTGFSPSITAPDKAGALAPEGISTWQPTPNASVDPTQPYLVNLDEGRSIAVFFYDGPASRAIAFEHLLNDGETFAKRLLSGFQPNNPNPQLAHVATDGESYGHHHRHGEMALSFAMHYIEENNLATLTNYAEFLEKFPPTWEAEVVDDSSWSCSHGVERWRSDCGCNGGKPGWNQRWRGPLRDALDLLRDRTAPLAEAVAANLFKDLWAARDAYIHVILDRSADNVDRFFAAHATHTLTPAERVTAFELLELQRHTQLMYTSCGWFFDDISGLETVQIIAYAGRVLQLAQKLFGEAAAPLETDFLTLLAQAKSNDPTAIDGAEVYRRQVLPTRLDLESVGAHYAISSMFRAYPDAGQIFCFDVRRHAYEVLSSGRGRFAVGQASLKSRITEETEDICFAVLHLGDQNLSAAVKRMHPSLNPLASNGTSASSTRGGRRSTDIVRSNATAPTSPFAASETPASNALLGTGFSPHMVAPPTNGALAPEAISDQAAWQIFIEKTRASIRRANLPELIRAIDAQFGGTLYSLTSLFADEQHRILKSILDATVTEVEDWLLRIYTEHATLLDFLSQANVPVPPALAVTAGFAINASLRRALDAEAFDSAEIAALLARATADHVTLDVPLLSYTADRRIKRSMVRLEAAFETHSSAQQGQLTLNIVNETLAIAQTLQTLPMEVNLWQAQNIWNDLLRRSDATYWSREWREGFRKIGHALNISVDELVTDSGVRAF